MGRAEGQARSTATSAVHSWLPEHASRSSPGRARTENFALPLMNGDPHPESRSTAKPDSAARWAISFGVIRNRWPSASGLNCWLSSAWKSVPKEVSVRGRDERAAAGFEESPELPEKIHAVGDMLQHFAGDHEIEPAGLLRVELEEAAADQADLAGVAEVEEIFGQRLRPKIVCRDLAAACGEHRAQRPVARSHLQHAPRLTCEGVGLGKRGAHSPIGPVGRRAGRAKVPAVWIRKIAVGKRSHRAQPLAADTTKAWSGIASPGERGFHG